VPLTVQGLLGMLVDTLMLEPVQSPFYSFLASAIESFLRASTAADRLFVAQRGLLDYVVGRLLSDDTTPLTEAMVGQEPSNLQCLFDLLAELVRFCAPALGMLDRGLSEAGFERLMGLTSTQLVREVVSCSHGPGGIERVRACTVFDDGGRIRQLASASTHIRHDGAGGDGAGYAAAHHGGNLRPG
jgi:hypothetical protein